MANRPTSHITAGGEPRRKIYVDGVGATIVAERVEYLDEKGRLITETLRDFTKKALKKRFASLDDFLRRWKSAERKQAIIEELENEGLSLDPLAEEVGKDLDPFDLICHVAFDQPALTRRERADNVRKRDVFTKYGPQARAVLEALLQKYQDQGVIDLGDPRILADPAASIQWERLSSSSRNSGHARISCSPSTNSNQPFTRRQLKPCPFAIPLNRFKTSCARIPASMATPSASPSSAGCSSSRSSTIRTSSLELMQDGYRSPIPAKLRWRTWAADPEGITGDELLAFINIQLFPQLKELSVAGKQGDRRRVVRDVFEDAYNYMKSGQLMRQVINKINEVDFQQSRRAPALRRHLRANPQLTCKAPAMPANTTPRAPSPPSWWIASIRIPAKSCSTPPAVQADSSPAPFATCASAT